MPILWFFRRDNNGFNEAIAGTDDIFLSGENSGENSKLKMKF